MSWENSLLPVFDGHNDMLLDLVRKQRSFFQRGDVGHIDLPRALEGGLAGGFCAVFVPSPGSTPPDQDKGATPAREPATAVELGPAQRATLATMARLFRIEAASAGRLTVIRTAGELESCLRDRVFAALLHIEGAEAIDPDLDALDVFYRAGLRSLGPVWSRSNAFGHGVPFLFPHSPDTGPGLTDLGRELVRACNRLRVMIDLSHLNERGFWDVARLSDAPLVATHSNAHAIAPSTRNLTDAQLDAIRESDGMVGVNFHVGFLRAGSGGDSDIGLEAVVRQIDYLVERLGIERVGFGSDFDGAVIPPAIGDATGLPRLLAALGAHGYDDAALRKLAHGNWVRTLRQTWGA